ncbi:MAG: adenylate kinase [Hymenobacteraceae bacterium]|nr:adenylate kinase [Hymenobacteraceae bacterium]
MLNIVLFGPPGAGKGTQSQKLIAAYGLVHLSTGDLLRSQIKAGTDLGLKAKALMDQGLLVPDEVVIGMIADKIRENPGVGGFIFDGFPRTTAQAEALDHLLSEHGTRIACMIALEVDEEEVTRRLLERGKISDRPDDQDETRIRRRVSVYNSETSQVAGYYARQDRFHGLNGVGDIETIFQNTRTVIDKCLKSADAA